MKRYIFIGGLPSDAPDGGKSFWREVVAQHQPPVIILECFFARLEEYWEIAMAKDWAMTQAYLPKRHTKLVLAQPEKFATQLQDCNVLILQGKNTEKLQAALAATPDWMERLDGKTIVASTAGIGLLHKFSDRHHVPLPSISLRDGEFAVFEE